MKDTGATKWHILAAVLIPVLMAPIDSSVVNVSFPLLAKVFNVGADLIGWVSMSYLLVTSSGLLSFGRLGDMFGFRQVFLIGIAIFAGGSGLCGISWNLGTLIVFRAIQAVGASITAALAPAIITATFPPHERGKALGMQGMAVAIGLTVGPSLGGMLLEFWGWRTVFFINLPISLIAFGCCYKLLPEKEMLKVERFDWQGASLIFTSLALFLFSISRGQYYQWSQSIMMSLFAAFIIGILFVWHEWKTNEPMLHLKLFRRQAFAIGNGAAVFHFITQYMVVFITPFLLQQELGMSPSKSGMIVTAFPLTSLLVSPLSGILSDKIGNRILSSTGAVLCSLGAFSLSAVTLGFTSAQIMWRLSLFGLGTGMFQSPNNSAIMGSVSKEYLGIAGAVLATARNVGMVLGIATAGSILALREVAYFSDDTVFPRLKAMHDVYITAAVFSILCFIGCIFVKTRKMMRKTSCSVL